MFRIRFKKTIAFVKPAEVSIIMISVHPSREWFEASELSPRIYRQIEDHFSTSGSTLLIAGPKIMIVAWLSSESERCTFCRTPSEECAMCIGDRTLPGGYHVARENVLETLHCDGDHTMLPDPYQANRHRIISLSDGEGYDEDGRPVRDNEHVSVIMASPFSTFMMHGHIELIRSPVTHRSITVDVSK